MSAHLVAIIQPGRGKSLLGRYFFNKPDEQYEAFDDLDEAMKWAEGLATVDDFDDLEWAETPETLLSILTGSRH